MLKKFTQRLLIRFNKSYVIDPAIPNSYISDFFINRLITLCRGFLLEGKVLFIGSNVKIKNRRNIRFGRGVTIERNCVIDGFARKMVCIGQNVRIGSYSIISSTSHMSAFGQGYSIGDNTGIGEFAYLGAAGGIEIGKDVIMGQYVSFHSQNHTFSEKNKLIRDQGTTSSGIRLGNDIWVGAKVTFLDGSEVGSHSVVAAGAVVTGKFPSHVVIGGVPARIIKDI